MFDFAETTKDMTASEILNYYRNLYYAEPQVTERGILANAINDYFADVVPKSEYADMEIRALRAEKQLATQQDLAESRKKDIEYYLSEIEKLQEAWFKKEDTMQMIVKEHQDELQKAKSEVVKEIIGEILLNHTPDIDGFFTMHESELIELKKKYVEESKNDR